MANITVLRWGHRPQRDARLTTHVALVARAFGASGIIISDIEDSKIKTTVNRVVSSWGGSFNFQMGLSWRRVIHDWKTNKGLVVHLTAYGENIESSDVLERIRTQAKDILIIVGSQKVPNQFFREEISDFNVAIGNQPHSECASLAVFLDRYFEGKELSKDYRRANVTIIPQKHGKRTIRNE